MKYIEVLRDYFLMVVGNSAGGRLPAARQIGWHQLLLLVLLMLMLLLNGQRRQRQRLAEVRTAIGKNCGRIGDAYDHGVAYRTLDPAI